MKRSIFPMVIMVLLSNIGNVFSMPQFVISSINNQSDTTLYLVLFENYNYDGPKSVLALNPGLNDSKFLKKPLLYLEGKNIPALAQESDAKTYYTTKPVGFSSVLITQFETEKVELLLNCVQVEYEDKIKTSIKIINLPTFIEDTSEEMSKQFKKEITMASWKKQFARVDNSLTYEIMLNITLNEYGKIKASLHVVHSDTNKNKK